MSVQFVEANTCAGVAMISNIQSANEYVTNFFFMICPSFHFHAFLLVVFDLGKLA